MKRFYKTMALVSLLGISNFSYGTFYDAEAYDREAIGRTALSMAASRGHAEAAKVLLGAGANKDAKDNDGCTPLYLAALGRRTEAVKVLLAAGARKDVKDKWESTPHDYAYSEEVRKLLKP